METIKKYRASRLLTLIVLVMVTACCAAQSPTIPAFSFQRMDNARTYSDKDVPAAKKSMFIFFDITCPHCQEALASLNKSADKLAGVTVQLITLDGPVPAMDFLSRHAGNLIKRKNVVVLRDSRNEFINIFKPVKYPSMFLYSKTKKLLLYSDEPTAVPRILSKIKTG